MEGNIMDRKEMIKKSYFQAKVMSLGMGMAVFIYGGLAYFLISMGKGGPAVAGAGTLQLLFYAMLIFSVTGIFLMRRVRDKVLNAGPSSGNVSGATEARHPQKLFLATVLLMAAAELPVLFGLVLVFIGRSFSFFLPFAGLSLVGFYLAFPQKQFWEEWLGENF